MRSLLLRRQLSYSIQRLPSGFHMRVVLTECFAGEFKRTKSVLKFAKKQKFKELLPAANGARTFEGVLPLECANLKRLSSLPNVQFATRISD